ncbi:MAG: hypothetical protein BWX98_02653 [Candidatus Aminicenantes bacterium ADurb.Bin147]|nr:MAG: hypothetical protein BWX98_02653 [Candidatus Aminicenantes bacterium ADurb.Bin147]
MIRSSKGEGLPLRASTLMAAAISAVERRIRASSIRRARTLHMTWVPLMRASPSLASSSRGSSPAESRASAAGQTVPSYSTSPSPIRARAMWARGARSPLAPTEPWEGMIGWSSRLRKSRSRWTTCSRTPLRPRAKLWARRRRMPRTTSAGNGPPTPMAWERIRFRWSSRTLSGSMRVFWNLPKPVLTP